MPITSGRTLDTHVFTNRLDFGGDLLAVADDASHSLTRFRTFCLDNISSQRALIPSAGLSVDKRGEPVVVLFQALLANQVRFVVEDKEAWRDMRGDAKETGPTAHH